MPLLPTALAVLGTLAALAAIGCERAMQRHRQPGVSYRDVTLRLDGAWKRSDLFTAKGLQYQKKASALGITAAALWIGAVVTYILIQQRG